MLKLYPYWINIIYQLQRPGKEKWQLFQTRFLSPTKLGFISAGMWTVSITDIVFVEPPYIPWAAIALSEIRVWCAISCRIVCPIFIVRDNHSWALPRNHAVYSFARGWWILLATTIWKNGPTAHMANSTAKILQQFL